MSNPAPNPNVPSIPQPIADVGALAFCVQAIKQGVDSLGGNRGPGVDPNTRAVTFNDLTAPYSATAADPSYTALQLKPYTVSQLGSIVQPTVPTGSIVYASNGLKPGETTGHGTGVPVFLSANGTWYSMCSGTAVAS